MFHDLVDNLENTLIDLMGPMGPLIAMGLAGVLCVLMTVPFFMRKRPDRFETLKTPGNRPAKAAEPEAEQEQLRPKDAGPKLDKFAAFLEPQDQEEFSANRMKMIQAGYRTKSAVRIFHFAQLVLGIAGLVLGLFYTFFVDHTTDMKWMAGQIIGPGFAGYYFPSYWIERRRATRQENIVNGFPDTLDLMLVCVEAGQSLDQAVQRLSKEMGPSCPEIAEELTIVSNEMRAGKERASVLRDFASRCNIQDISSFVTVMIQSATFGTSLGEALRVYAVEMRDKRVTRAEEQANKLPTKMTLATMMFTLPPLLVILVGPSVYNIYANMVLNNN